MQARERGGVIGGEMTATWFGKTIIECGMFEYLEIFLLSQVLILAFWILILQLSWLGMFIDGLFMTGIVFCWLSNEDEHNKDRANQ